MTDDPQVAQQFAELPEETRKFLSALSPDDVKIFGAAIPIIRAVIGFGKVTKWLVIGFLGLLAGTVMLGESALKILSWLKHG